MMPTFATFVDALRHWETRDQRPLAAATIPPCDALDDEVYNTFLSVIFRDIVRLDSVVGRLGRIDAAIQANQPMVDYCRERGAEDSAARIEAMTMVLETWAAEIGDAAESRAA